MNIPRGPPMVPSPPERLLHQCQQRSHSPVFEVRCPDSSLPGKGMAIPGTATYRVPPPLPPPRHIQDLDAGVDISWTLQNQGVSEARSAFVPIKSGSSLLGSLLHNQSVEPGDGEAAMDWEPGSVLYERKMNTRTPHPHLTLRTAHPYILSSRDPHSALSPRLQGEQPLSRKNHSQFTDAYDKHMLLKIGKSTSALSSPAHASNIQMSSPPRLRIPGHEARDLPELVQAPSTNTRRISTLPSPVAIEHSPWHNQQTNLTTYSSAYDTTSSLPNPFAVYSETSNRLQKLGSRSEQRRQHTGSHLDQLQHRDDTSEHHAEHAFDTNRERTPDPESVRPALRLGTKRRALSPAAESMLQDDRRSSQASSHSAEGNVGKFDTNHPPQRTGSLSSTTSSAYPLSSVSSYLLSATSSLTSASTLDLASLRSPAEFTTPDLSVRTSTVKSESTTPLRKPSEAILVADTSFVTAANVVKPTASRIGPVFMCSCCPKRPKRFENEKHLRQHENEKQYACGYCSNRFKNKNEAERHQNSLHLRKQSWSCAAIISHETAFQTSTNAHQHDPTYDICGFCGLEFSNHPRDWNVRIDHLRDTHKFGECNATKKFYRADHFRQHLKHSHAGKSGKWTNILENSCQREGAVSESGGLSPSASDNSLALSTSHTTSKSINPSDLGTINSGVELVDEMGEGLYANADYSMGR